MYHYSVYGDLHKKSIIENFDENEEINFTPIPENNQLFVHNDTDIYIDSDKYFIEIEAKTKRGNEVIYGDSSKSVRPRYNSKGITVLFLLNNINKISFKYDLNNNKIVIISEEFDINITSGGDSTADCDMHCSAPGPLQQCYCKNTIVPLVMGENGKLELKSSNNDNFYKIYEKENNGGDLRVIIRWVKKEGYDWDFYKKSFDIKKKISKDEFDFIFQNLDYFMELNPSKISKEEIKLIPSEEQNHSYSEKLVLAGFSKEGAEKILNTIINDEKLNEIISILNKKIIKERNMVKELLEVILNIHPDHKEAQELLMSLN